MAIEQSVLLLRRESTRQELPRRNNTVWHGLGIVHPKLTLTGGWHFEIGDTQGHDIACVAALPAAVAGFDDH